VARSIAAPVDPRAICLQISASDWVSVLALLGCRLHESGSVRPGFTEALVEQERAHPSGMRLAGTVGVAIPRPDPDLVIRPGLAVATLAQSVLFGSQDSPRTLVPVRLVLLLASRELDAQLDALRWVTRLLQAQTSVESMLEAKSVAFVASSIHSSRNAHAQSALGNVVRLG
jgi:galactitol PTS system EIIA component